MNSFFVSNTVRARARALAFSSLTPNPTRVTHDLPARGETSNAAVFCAADLANRQSRNWFEIGHD